MNVCAVTDNPQCSHSVMSDTLLVVTTPKGDLIPTLSDNNDDSYLTSFDRNKARIIPLQIESINEEKLHLDWTSFFPATNVFAYDIHYACLNNGEEQAVKVSKRHRETVSSKKCWNFYFFFFHQGSTWFTTRFHL